jgi:hypothetical protein
MTFNEFCKLRNWQPTIYQHDIANKIVDAINSDSKLVIETARIGVGTTEVFKMVEGYFKLNMTKK